MPDTPAASEPDDNATLTEADQHLKQGRYGDAERLYRQLLSAHPEVAELYINLAVVARARGRAEEAMVALMKALELSPGHPGALFNLANVQSQVKQVAQAVQNYRACLVAAPDFADAALNLADLLRCETDDTGARRVLERAIGHNPRDARLRNNLGNLYKDAGQLADAAAQLREATRLAPEIAEFKKNLGAVLLAQGRPRRALRHLVSALRMAPGDADTHCLRAFAHLALGEFDKGWQEYGWRWRSAEHQSPRPFRQPWWKGESLAGKTILIWGEQGIGDEIMFASILSDVVDDAGHVIVECEPRLAALLARSFPDLDVIARRNHPDRRLKALPIDYQLPIADLARFYRSRRADFGAGAPYLKADPARRDELRRRYETMARGRRLIGLSWKSGASRSGRGRSLKAADMMPLAGIADAFFVNLQYGDVETDLQVLRQSAGLTLYHDPDIDQMQDMDDYAAQVAALDAVISCANTIVHVAGGLGVGTTVLIPEAADWRWLAEGTHSHWYASLYLYRNRKDQDMKAFMRECVKFITSDPQHQETAK